MAQGAIVRRPAALVFCARGRVPDGSGVGLGTEGGRLSQLASSPCVEAGGLGRNGTLLEPRRDVARTANLHRASSGTAHARRRLVPHDARYIVALGRSGPRGSPQLAVRKSAVAVPLFPVELAEGIVFLSLCQFLGAGSAFDSRPRYRLCLLVPGPRTPQER